MQENSHKLFRNSVLYTLGSAGQRLLGLLLLPIYTRYLSPDEYGVIGLLVPLISIIIPIFSIGLSASIGVCYFQGATESDRSAVIKTAVIITRLSCCILIAATYFNLNYLVAQLVGADEYTNHLLVVILTAAFGLLVLPYQLECQFHGQAGRIVLVTLISTIFAAIVGLVLVTRFELTSFGVLVAGLVGQGISLLLFSVLSQNVSNTFAKVHRKNAIDLITYGLPMLPSLCLLFLIQNMVRWPLEKQFGASEVGIYALGINFGSVMGLVCAGFVSAWLPWALSLSKTWDKDCALVGLRFSQAYTIGGGAVCFFFIFAKPVASFLLDEAFFNSWSVIGLSAFAALFTALFSLLLPPVYIAKKVWMVLISQGLALLVLIVSLRIFIQFGAAGAALCTVIASGSMCFFQVLVNRWFLKVTDTPINIRHAMLVVMLVVFIGTVSFYINFELSVVCAILVLFQLIFTGVATYYLLVCKPQSIFYIDIILRFSEWFIRKK